MLKVLHIIPSLQSGGAEKMLVDVIEEMRKSNIQVEVLVLSKKGDFYSREIQKMQVPIYFSNCNRIYHPAQINSIRKHLKRDFDIIHTHLYAPQIFAAIAKRFLRKYIPLVTTEHNTHNRRRDIAIFKLLDRWMYAQYDQIYAISDATKTELNTYLPSTRYQSIVIQNGIKIDLYRQAKALPPQSLIQSFQAHDKLIVMVAAMRIQKDHETVIRATKNLPFNYHILFVGEGERMETVKNYAEKYGAKNIHFLGRRSDVPEIMKTCDVFVLPSKWEGFGLAAIEALAAGLPIIISDVPGLKEFANGREEFVSLIQPGDDVDLAEKIITMTKKTKITVPLESYSIRTTVKVYLEEYQKTCRRSLKEA